MAPAAAEAGKRLAELTAFKRNLDSMLGRSRDRDAAPLAKKLPEEVKNIHEFDRAVMAVHGATQKSELPEEEINALRAFSKGLGAEIEKRVAVEKPAKEADAALYAEKHREIVGAAWKKLRAAVLAGQSNSFHAFAAAEKKNRPR
ncbi:MAG: hypothetical protein NTY90_05760 [Candidatus Micrarchaeota archaeon]|nr:hypothetical protein [Candidatus Micrarchaeota archaeon]